MEKLQGAIIKEQGVTFAIVVVKPHVVSNRAEASNLINGSLAQLFGGIPVVLMAQNSRGVPTYLGRQDIVNFLAQVPLNAIPWKEYTIG